MGTGAEIDWNKVVQELSSLYVVNGPVGRDWTELDAAIDLCERMAKGELVERSDVAAFSLNYKRRLRYCTCDQQWKDPNCTAVNHD